MVNNSNRQNELETADGEHSERKIRIEKTKKYSRDAKRWTIKVNPI